MTKHVKMSFPIKNANFSSSLHVDVSFKPDDILNEFMEGYHQAFILPEEKEEFNDFKTLLNQNHAPLYSELSRKFGPFASCVFVIKDHHKVIAGASLDMFGSSKSMHLNYCFVDEHHRQKGLLKNILEASHQICHNLSGSSHPFLLFLEINNPQKMPINKQRLDEQHSGLNQDTRLLVWERVGASLIDAPYIQPSLSKDKEPCRDLLLACIAPQVDCLPSQKVYDHLWRFFGLSVLKGQGSPKDMVFLENLLSQKTIPLVKPSSIMTKNLQEKSRSGCLPV